MIDSAITSAALLAAVGIANVFGWIMAAEEIPQTIAKAMLSVTNDKNMIILFPTLMAVAVKVGIDPVHFATFAVLNLMIGLTTPPVGVCLFVCANIAKAPLSPVIKSIFPFLIGNIIALS